MGQRQRRRPRLDPSKIDVNHVTGDENVSVVNRATGKRITGAKAPPIRYLKEWLLRNPDFDVDPKWGHIVKAKVNFSDQCLITNFFVCCETVIKLSACCFAALGMASIHCRVCNLKYVINLWSFTFSHEH